jgi:pimeloyl-ACP methyl ester carboxylesterase
MFADFDRETRHAVLRLYRATSNFDEFAAIVTRSLAGLNLPVLVVWGKQDPYVPVRFADQQREVFPDAQVTILEDSGHWPFADNPEAVAQVVVPFLRNQLTRAART